MALRSMPINSPNIGSMGLTPADAVEWILRYSLTIKIIEETEKS